MERKPSSVLQDYLEGDRRILAIPLVACQSSSPLQQAGRNQIPWMGPENHLSLHRAPAARLNLAAGTLPSFYLLPKRASENNSKTSRSFRPRLSLTTGHRMPIKPHQQASHRFQSNTVNGDVHTKAVAHYTKGPASAQRPRESKHGTMNGAGDSMTPHSISLGSTVIMLRSSKRNNFRWHNI